MKTAILVAFIGVVGLALTAAEARDGGLYADDKNVTTGDLCNQDYWWTRFDLMMLDLAIEQRQPEGLIAVNLASTSPRIESLMKEYPRHEGLKQMKDRVDSVLKRIDPNASRNASWKPGCPWDESNFAQAWVNYHWGKMELAAKNEQQALGLFDNVQRNFGYLTREGRMADYPENLQKWVHHHKDEVDKTCEELRQRLNR